MEFETGKDNKKWVFLAEMLGTMILIVAVNYGGSSDGLAYALAQFGGFVLFGQVSMAHFNPAVTFATLIKCGLNKDNFILTSVILGAQTLGAILGIFWVRMSITVDEGTIESNNVNELAVDEGFASYGSSGLKI